VEEILLDRKTAIDTKILLMQTPDQQWAESTVYRFDDMLAALRVMYQQGVAGKTFYMGDESDIGHKYGLVNLAAFLAQSMKETIKYDACDENSWDLVAGRYPLANSCGQLGQSYQVGAGVDFELLSNSLTFESRNPQLPGLPLLRRRKTYGVRSGPSNGYYCYHARQVVGSARTVSFLEIFRVYRLHQAPYSSRISADYSAGPNQSTPTRASGTTRRFATTPGLLQQRHATSMMVSGRVSLITPPRLRILGAARKWKGVAGGKAA